MKSFISSIIGLTVLLSSSPAFAATMRGNVLTPDGFCAIHQDKTRGVRFDGYSYTTWLAVYAITAERLAQAVSTETKLSDQEIGQLKARLRKAAAEMQRSRIDHGQVSLCK